MTIPKTEMGNVFDICQSLEMVIEIRYVYPNFKDITEYYPIFTIL